MQLRGGRGETRLSRFPATSLSSPHSSPSISPTLPGKKSHGDDDDDDDNDLAIGESVLSLTTDECLSDPIASLSSLLLAMQYGPQFLKTDF